MSGKITNAIEDVNSVHAFAEKTAPLTLSLLSNLTLGVVLVVVTSYGLFGPDRWTQDDHKEYATEAKSIHARLSAATDRADHKASETQTDIKVILSDMEYLRNDMKEIKELLRK